MHFFPDRLAVSIFDAAGKLVSEIKNGHSDTVFGVAFSPDGKYLTGWADIAAEWDRQAALMLGGRVEPTRLHSVVGEDLAVITCVEAGVNETGVAGKTVSIRSSTVFRREHGAWKVIGHQTDLLAHV